MASREHDYTHRYWGHDFTFDPIDGGQRGRMCVFGRTPRVGDHLILPNGSGTTRYRIESVRSPSDPGDQHFLDVAFDPREA